MQVLKIYYYSLAYILYYTKFSMNIKVIVYLFLLYIKFGTNIP